MFALGSGEYGSGLGVDEQLRNFGVGEPAGVFVNYFDHVGRFAVQRDIAGPGERGSARFARFEVWFAVHSHFLVAEIADYAARQDSLDKDVVFQNHEFAGVGAKSLEYTASGVWPLIPSEALDYRFHVGDSGDALRVSARPVERQRGAPVVADQSDSVEFEGVEPGVEVAGVIYEPVRAGRHFAGISHSDEIGRKAARASTDMRNYVTPQIRACGVAMQEYDRRALACIHVGYFGVKDVGAFSWMWVEG